MTIEQTTLCYIASGDSYLMLHRTKKDGDMNHDKWMGVGGHFEYGESPEECMIREVFEETGLQVTDYRYRGIVTFVLEGNGWNACEYMHLFTVDGFTGDLIECNEGDLEWVKKEDVLSLPMWAGDRIFLPLICSDKPFFSLKLTYKGDTLTGAILDGKELSLGEN